MGCEMICCNTNDMMFAWRDPSASTAWWIHSFIHCVVLFTAAEASHQRPNGSVPWRRQQGTWCCVDIPWCDENQECKIRGYLRGELEEEVNLHIPACNMHESIFHHMLHIEFLSYRHCSDHEWMLCTLVSSLQSALCNGDPFSATELIRRKHKHRFPCSSSACEELRVVMRYL